MEAQTIKRKSSDGLTFEEEKKSRPNTGISINLAAKPAVPKVNMVMPTFSPKVNLLSSTQVNKNVQSNKANPIAMKLGAQKPKEPDTLPVVQSSSVAAAFNEDSDEDVEEMPKSAKMRMKNIGRDTPTSSGPKSFNKSKTGFQNTARNWEREIDEIGKEDHERSQKS